MRTYSAVTRGARAFSLLEVVLAMFILGIGLIMVATIFPVGADWTRQSAEDSVAQTIAQNALSIINSHYGPTSTSFSPSANTLTALPGFVGLIPLSERCYQFGNPTPFPATDPMVCTYYWTALYRAQPGQNASASTRYDLYILVFRKGAAEQTFTAPFPGGASEVNGVRDTSPPTGLPGMIIAREPTLLKNGYNVGNYDNSLKTVTNAVPPIGYIGIGQTSGTVFRQGLDATKNPPIALARPGLAGSDNQVIYAAPADNTGGSPLIYVYQTTISF